MGTLDDARAHLDKSREFLEAARLAADAGLHNAATSDAVISGVNAKDAICLRLTGVTGKADDHRAAVRELSQSGRKGRVGADAAAIAEVEDPLPVPARLSGCPRRCERSCLGRPTVRRSTGRRQLLIWSLPPTVDRY